MSTPATPAHDAYLREDLKALNAQGYLILPELLNGDELATLRDELAPWFGLTPPCVGDFHGWATTRVNGLLNKAPIVQGLALHERILPIAETLLAESCDCIRLNLTQAIRIHPGERAQAPHRDEEMWPGDPGGKIWSLNVMWAVSAFSRENGATRLWPGSHRQRLDRTPDAAAAIAAEMAPGSALIYLGGLTHSGGANSSTHDRTGVVVGYCAGWLRTYEEQYLTYPPEVAAAFPQSLQRLIGYQTHRPNLGTWEGQDPIACLQGGRPCGAHRDALSPELAAQLKAVMAASGG